VAGPTDAAESHHPSFAALLRPQAALQRLWSGAIWAEGPVWFAESGSLLFSDIPNDRMLRWQPQRGVCEFRRPSHFSNGNTRDRQGNLITCEHGRRCVSRTGADGRTEIVVDRYRGRRLNSPNDVVVKRDGTVWFTDPPYGIESDHEGHKAEREQDGNYVYRFDPASGALAVVADDFDRPNGLAFSPDERRLYVADSGFCRGAGYADPWLPGHPHHVRVFDVDAAGRLSGGEVFAVVEPGIPDGLRVDTEGRLWASAGDGVHCHAPDGTLLGKVRVPEAVANLTFGGPHRNVLYMTATSSLYAIETAVAGV